MFRPVQADPNISQMEEGVLRSWRHRHVFEKSRVLREDGEAFVTYENPSTANGKPGMQHVLARSIRDLFLRYKSMNGYRVLRRAGWNTHGLPVENQVERELGLTSKSQIEEYGIERFNERCRRSVFTYIQDWERLTERIAFWLDLDDAYVTFTNEYIESIWWLLKSLWEKELLYQGFKVAPYCPRCGTPLSDHEVSLGYRETIEPSIYVRLPLVEEPGTSLLIWTTSPWKLPGNVAVAADPEDDYVIIEREQPEGGYERLILAEAALPEVFKDEQIETYESFKGRKLKDLHYRPLFTFLLPDKKSHYVILGDYVKTNQGTGLVHIAPAFGEVDMQAALEHDLPIFETVTEEGTFIPEVRPWSGKFVHEVGGFITQDLYDRGLLYRADTLSHTYPFCRHCNTPLIYHTRNTWYLRTTEYKEKLMAFNQGINWIPDHIQSGRFGEWLKNEVDWALARERYWGTPLPIWECKTCHHQLAIGSLAELAELAGENLDDLDLHRPYVDEVSLPCPECGEKMDRVAEVVDVWLDSGSMPLAQWHYPFENESQFQEQFPADLLCETIDQTAGWLYALQTISSLIFERASFKNALGLGSILDGQGHQMSKSGGNLVEPWEVINVHGADAVRWYLYTVAPAVKDRRFTLELVGEVVRNFTLPIWNVYRFFVTYARVEGWRPSSALTPLAPLSQTPGEGGRENEASLDHAAQAPAEGGSGSETSLGHAAQAPGEGGGGSEASLGHAAQAPGEGGRESEASLGHAAQAPGGGGRESEASLDRNSETPGEGGGSGEVLDRWLLSELHRLIQDVTAAYENYDVPGATRPIQTFLVDKLSKWYLRRSRRRFWKGNSARNKNAAFETLYTALLTSSRLLAPATPLLAEELYQNLVLSIDPEAPESVQLNDWPTHDPALIDATLNAEMKLVRQLASLGHAARQQAGIKVRQPLSSAAFSVASASEREALERYVDLLAEELNVKTVRLLDPGEQGISYGLNPLPGRLGQKFQARYPAVREAIVKLDADSTAKLLLKGDPIQVSVQEEMLTIQPNEVEVQARPDPQTRPGLETATDGPYLVVLVSELTAELLSEGWAREFIRHVQQMRKETGLDLTDQIRVHASATPGLEEVLQSHREYVLADTRADELSFVPVPDSAVVKRVAFEEEAVDLGIETM